MNKKVVVLARQRHGSQRVQRSCGEARFRSGNASALSEARLASAAQRLRSTGLPETGLPPIVHGHDAQHDRENLKSNYNQEFLNN